MTTITLAPGKYRLARKLKNPSYRPGCRFEPGAMSWQAGMEWLVVRLDSGELQLKHWPLRSRLPYPLENDHPALAELLAALEPVAEGA